MIICANYWINALKDEICIRGQIESFESYFLDFDCCEINIFCAENTLTAKKY